MKKIRKLSYPFIAILLVGLSLSAFAQTKYQFEIGIIDSVYSVVLNESREIYIQYPLNYSPENKEKYPVIYVLDGDVLSKAVSTVQDFYSGGFMPEMIIVGISNDKNRDRDLTISKVEHIKESGEADNFIKFIETELIPYVENKYPASNYRTLIGHSHGGLFTINAMVNHSDLFTNYIAIDPSLDWDNQKLLKYSKETLSNSSLQGKSLFVTLSGQLHMQNYDITIDNVMQDTTEHTLFARSIIDFYNFSEDNINDNFNINWKYYKNDLHGTVPLPSIMDGLLSLFEWYQMEGTDKINNPETPVEELVGIIRYRENKLKSHFGYFVAPYPQDLLNILGYMSMDMGQFEKSLAYFKLNIEYYPESANTYDSMSDYYIMQKNYDEAIKYVQKAFEINNNEYYKNKIEDIKGMKK